MMRTFARKSASIGVLMAAIFLVVDVVAPAYVGYETLIFGFAMCLLLVCCALVDTARDGLICGLTALAAQNVGTFLRYTISNGLEVAAAASPYPLLLTSTYLIAGAIGGYLGGKLTIMGRAQAPDFSRGENQTRKTVQPFCTE
jgi:hypothetical protein